MCPAPRLVRSRPGSSGVTRFVSPRDLARVGWRGGVVSWALRECPLAPCLVSFPCFLLVSLQHPLNSEPTESEAGLGPKSAKSANTVVFCGYTWKTPGIPGKYPRSLPVSSVSPQILPQTSSQTQGNSRVARMEQEWSTNHPLVPWKLPETQSAGDPATLWFP